MKKIIFFLLIFYPSISIANNLAIIDIDFILNNSKIGKETNTKVQKQKKKIFENLKKKEQNLKKKEKNILVKKKLLSEEEFKNEIEILRTDIKKFNDLKKKELENLQAQKVVEYEKIYKKINEILIKYSEENNIETVIDKRYVLISKTKNDISNNILKILDK